MAIGFNKNRSLAAYTYAHFAVDFGCFCLLFGCFLPAAGSPETASLGFLLYNIVAFGLQPIIGYLCDEKRRLPIALVGCGLLLAALALGGAAAWAALVFAALGNACFHVGGGIDSLVYAGGRAARSGVFVSSGALGVALGTFIGKLTGFRVLLPIIAVLLGAALLVLFAPAQKSAGPYETGFTTANAARGAGLVIALCAVSIVVRSYAGSVVPMGWKTTAALALLPGAASALGKAAGGFLADRFGARLIGVGSLALSAPLLALGQNNAALCLAGIALFNMTMPITLCAVAAKLPANPGLAFGITTLALLCGNVPTFFFALGAPMANGLVAVLTLVSAGCLFVAVGPRLREKSPKIRRESAKAL